MKRTKNNACIYKITSPSGRVYIGQTVNFTNRMYTYKSIKSITRGKDDTLIHKSLIKYGFDNHKSEIIEYCDVEFLNSREEYWIEFYNTNIVKYPKNKGLNLCSGGVTKKEEFLNNIFRKDKVYDVADLIIITTARQESILKTLFKSKTKSTQNYINRGRLILTYINLYELLLNKPVTLNIEKFARSLGVNKSNMCYIMTELKSSRLLYKVRSHAIHVRSSTYKTRVTFNNIIKQKLHPKYIKYVNKIITENMIQINEDIDFLFKKYS